MTHIHAGGEVVNPKEIKFFSLLMCFFEPFFFTEEEKHPY